jgi:hypothetical protein
MKFPKRENGGGGGSGPTNFLRLKDGETVTGILRGDLYSFFSVGFGANTKVVGPGEGGKERYRHNIVVKEGDGYVAKIWEFGSKIYDDLSALEASGWDLQNTLITIARKGSTKENTKYTVTPVKKEPAPATMKIIESLELNTLEHTSRPPTQADPGNVLGLDDGVPF